MTSQPLMALGGLAGVLVALLLLEHRGARLGDATLPAAPSSPAAARPGAPVVATSNLQTNVATLLARPLFVTSRRPAPASAVIGASGQIVLPRLSAVLVSAAGRSLIFGGGADGKPIVVAEGGQIGQYRVQSIDPGEAVVVGPDSVRTLRPSFTGLGEKPWANVPSKPTILEILRSQPMTVGIPSLSVRPSTN